MLSFGFVLFFHFAYSVEQVSSENITQRHVEMTGRARASFLLYTKADAVNVHLFLRITRDVFYHGSANCLSADLTDIVRMSRHLINQSA